MFNTVNFFPDFPYQPIHILYILVTIMYQDVYLMTDKIRINRIKVVLAELEITQRELAKRVNKAPNTITRICNNESQPTLKLLREIAIALDVDIRDLLIPIKNNA